MIRIDWWFNPKIVLVIIDKIIIIKIKFLLFKYIKEIKGIIFCHVDKIKQLIQFILFIILINQLWNGGFPIFINNEKLINKIINIFILNEFKNIKLDEIINKDDLIAWIIKYLIDNSL